MNDVDMVRAYELFHRLALRGRAYSPKELSMLTAAANKEASSLKDAQSGFVEAMEGAETALSIGDDDALVANLISMRVNAMNMVADLDNVVDAISDLFERRSVRQTGGQ